MWKRGNGIASIWMSYRFIKMAAAAAEYYFRFRICWYRCLQKVKVYLQTKFCRHNYINRWLRYNYFRFLKNKRPPYWKSTFGFDHFPEICTLFCIRLPNFVQIELEVTSTDFDNTAEIWGHIHFSKWRPLRLNTTSGFVSVDVIAFRRSKFISKPNFVEISQMEADIFFMEIQNGLGKGEFFFWKSRMCQYPGMFCYILWIQKCIFDACRQRLHNSGLICNQATALYQHATTNNLSMSTLFTHFTSQWCHSDVIFRQLVPHLISISTGRERMTTNFDARNLLVSV